MNLPGVGTLIIRPVPGPAIDEGVLQRYRALQGEHEPDVVTEFIDAFLDDLPARLARLRAAIGSGQAAEVRAATRGLKGSAGSVGAVGLFGLCAQLESIAGAGSLDGAADLLAAIEPEAVGVRSELIKRRKA